MSEWIELGMLDAIPTRGARIVRANTIVIAVFRTSDDKVFALENKCAHKGGPLSEGIVHGCKVTCPLHNWVFDMETGNATGADKGTVQTFPIKIIDGKVFLSLVNNELDERAKVANG